MASASLFYVDRGRFAHGKVVSSSSAERESESKGRKEKKNEKILLHVLPCIDLLLDEGAVTIVWLHSLVQCAGDSVSSPSTCPQIQTRIQLLQPALHCGLSADSFKFQPIVSPDIDWEAKRQHPSTSTSTTLIVPASLLGAAGLK